MSKYSFDNKSPEIQNILSGEGKAEIHHMIQDAKQTNCNFIIMLVLPEGASIGLHRHETSDEEIYIIISGKGEMQEGNKAFTVGYGDVIINPPGEEHSLKNIGNELLKVVALDVPAKLVR